MGDSTGGSRLGQAAPGPGARRWPRVVGLVVVGLVLSAVFGVTTASADGALGPHHARYQVTTDDTVTIDLGPLGTLQMDSPLPLTLGVRATVQEIPDSLVELGSSSTLAALSGDVASYVQFFSAPAAAVHDVTVALEEDAARRTVAMFALLASGWWAARLLLGAARRSELTARLRPHRRLIAGSVALALVGAGVLTSSVGATDRRVASAPVSPVFAGTALEGARVTGRLGGVIDTYGGYVLNALQENDAFYAAADKALVAAWDRRPAEPEAWYVPTPSVAPSASATPSASASSGASDGPGTPSATSTDATPGAPVSAGVDGATSTSTSTPASTPSPSPSPTRTRLDDDRLVTVVVVSDLHCNVGMASLIRSLATLSGAQVVLDAGDDTIDGTVVEQYCVTTFAQSIPKGVALVTSPGNHDSQLTSAMYARAGATVLAGGVVEVAGMRILGDHDPYETRLVSGTTQVSDETVEEAGTRLAKVACDDGAVDLLLIHTPRVGTPALQSGCVPAQISGHLHKRTDPTVVDQGVRYISSSTAGAVVSQPTVGPLHGRAEMTVLRWSPQTRRFVDYRVVSVDVDGSAAVGAAQPWPVVPVVTDQRSAGAGASGGSDAGGQADGGAPTDPSGAVAP